MPFKSRTLFGFDNKIIVVKSKKHALRKGLKVMYVINFVDVVKLCGFSLMLSLGQILFKFSAKSMPSLLSVEGMKAAMVNLWLWAALVLYGLATVLWIVILQKIPLSKAYPFVALGFAVVPIAAHFLFGEPLSFKYAVGSLLIMSGIYLCVV